MLWVGVLPWSRAKPPIVTGPLYVKVALVPGASAYPASARVCMVPCLVEEVSAISDPLGATTKNSEFFDIGPIAELGIHPPLGVVDEVRATKWKIIVAFPTFETETESDVGLRVADVSWNFVMYQIEVGTLFLQSFLSPTCG